MSKKISEMMALASSKSEDKATHPNLIIQIKNLNKIFLHNKQSTSILENINLELAKGSCTILKGISGSGKTTLLSLIAGLDKPSSGKIIIENEAISKLPDLFVSAFRASKIGMIFQHFNLLDNFSVFENVSVPLIPLGYSRKEIQSKIESALNLAHIAHKAHTSAQHLSGGEKQRTAIARALVNNPNILLCDEPTANLDHDNSLRFIQTIKELHALGKTIIIATHDPLFDSLDFPHKSIQMQNGKMV